MNNKQFSDALGNLQDKYYMEAAGYKQRSKRGRLLPWAALAACLVFVIFVGYLVTSPPLPQLTLSQLSGEGMGFEAYDAYDIDELRNENPWNEEMSLSTLPVYENPVYITDRLLSRTADWDEMRTFLLEVAERVGLDPSEVTITDDTPDEETKKAITNKLEGDVPEDYFDPTMLVIQADGLVIEVDQSMTATVHLDPGIDLPSQYDTSDEASYDELREVAGYLKTEYEQLIGMEDPQIDVQGGHYDIHRNQSYSIEFFEGKDKEVDQILSYQFDRVAFSFDEKGKLFIVRIHKPDLSQLVGHYPIISAEEARDQLSSGDFITTVPEDFPGKDYIKKTELIYRTGYRPGKNYHMPYYRFLVELPEMKDGELTTFGAFYVPAVVSEYLTDMPTTDGSLNR